MTFHDKYTRYINSLPREQRCACGERPLGQCSRCSQKPIPKEMPIDSQLTFAFVTPIQTSFVYDKE